MITPIDERLRLEADAYRLRFSCRDCAHFALESEACASGYPNLSHKDAELGGRRTLEFCKEFELV